MTVDVVHSGVGGLDEILGGGFPAGRLYLVQGTPGAGKTTLGLQFLLEGAARGERGLYITLSETREELEAVASSHGWSLDAITLYELAPRGDDLSLESQQTVFPTSEIELNETMQTLLARVEESKPTRVVFDSLSEIRLLAQTSLRYRRQILALKHYFAGSAATVLLLDDLTSSPTDQGLQSLAHGVITLEQTSSTYGVDRRRIRVGKLRGVRFRTGYHDFTITTGGLEIYPRLIAAEHHREFPRAALSTGLPPLDSLLGGGIPRGNSVLLTGPPGTGKSAIITQIATAAARRGERSVLFTFEENRGTTLARAHALGNDLEAQIDAGLVVVRQVNPADLSPGEFVDEVRRAVEKHDARIIAIDSLNGYLNAMPRENYLLSQLHELTAYLGQAGVVTLMTVAQQGLMGSSMVTPVDASYLADVILLLRYFEAQGCIRKAISVLKHRSAPHENMIRELVLSSDGIGVGEPLEHFRGVLTGVPTYSGDSAPLQSAGRVP